MGVTKKQMRKQEMLEKQKIAGMAVFALGMCALGMYYHCSEPADAGASLMLMALGFGLFTSKKRWFL